MPKSVNDYYKEKMNKLLEMQKEQNAAQLSSPQKNAPESGRGYYDNFRAKVASPKAPPRQVKNGQGVRKTPLDRDPLDRVRKERQKTTGSQRAGAQQKKQRPKVSPEQTAEDRYEEYLRHVDAVQTAKRARIMRKVRDTLVSLILIVCVFALMCVVVYRLLFVINSVSAKGFDAYSSEELVLASGVKEGEHLFSFSSREVGELIKLRCPEICEVDVERTPPGTIVFNVTEESPSYYADFYGEYRMLSESLRVLGSVTEADAKERGCIKIVLPDVYSATAGLSPEFADVKNDEYIFETATAVLNSSLRERAGKLDVSDKYNMTLTVDGKYILRLGEAESIETKLRIAAAVLENEMFQSDMKATIDVTDLSESSVIEDPGLKVD